MAGFLAAIKVRASEVEVCLNSWFIVSQFRGDFEAKDLRMSEYLKVAPSMHAQFKLGKVTQISQGENSHVDSLAF